MRALTQWFWAVAFGAVPILVLAQVAWWATVFTRDADIIAGLQTHNIEQAARASGAAVPDGALDAVRNDAYHRKLMFLSESAFFAVLSCIGIWLIFRAVRNERRLREGQRGFIEMVSHESKTPLTALKLRLEALREKRRDSEESEELFQALEEVRRLSGVLEKTLVLNRSERHALQFELLGVAEIVESVLGRLKPWLKSQNVELSLKMDSEVQIHGDFPSLQGSVQSLLENAVRYNPSVDKKVAVEVVSREGRAVLRIADNGPGISALDGDKVFDRFFRGSGGQKVPGTGLGLYFTKAIVEAHRGKIRLGDASPGALFEIEIPQARPV